MEKIVWIVKNKDSDRPKITETHSLYCVFSSPETADVFLNATQKLTKEEAEVIKGKLIY